VVLGAVGLKVMEEGFLVRNFVVVGKVVVEFEAVDDEQRMGGFRRRGFVKGVALWGATAELMMDFGLLGVGGRLEGLLLLWFLVALGEQFRDFIIAEACPDEVGLFLLTDKCHYGSPP
jgi:hypothetical protein